MADDVAFELLHMSIVEHCHENGDDSQSSVIYNS